MTQPSLDLMLCSWSIRQLMIYDLTRLTMTSEFQHKNICSVKEKISVMASIAQLIRPIRKLFTTIYRYHYPTLINVYLRSAKTTRCLQKAWL